MKYFNKNPKPNKKLERCHYTYNGKCKVSYKTEAEAKEVLKKYPETYVAYLCPICNKWHIGFIKV
jgi:hypothetical protein